MPRTATAATVLAPATTQTRRRRRGGWVAERLGRHWLLLAVLIVGLTMRVLATVAYPPALFFSDSWAYLSTAFAHQLVSLPYLRPVGYSLLIRLLTIPGRDVTQLIVIQHLAGLANGVLVYAALLRARLPRAPAAASAALVLVDGYRITLEQYVMPDTLFALTLLVALLLLAWPRLQAHARRDARPAGVTAGASGFLLAAAAIQRDVGLFAIPVVAAYLIWISVGWRPVLAFLAAVALPLGGYAGVMDVKTGVFGLSATSGWTLYSRVAGFADCAGAGVAPAARPLCETSRERASHPRVPDWYMWDSSSPAIRLFHRGHETRTQRARANAILGAFARRIILHQPGALISATVGDALRYFTPGATPYADPVSATSLPSVVGRETIDERIRRRVLPAAHPAVRAPAEVVRGFRRLVHVPRPVLALLALIALAGLCARVPARREVLLFAGTGFVLLLGTSVTAGFGLRYLMPIVPLLAVGGALAAHQLLVSRRFGPWRRVGPLHARHGP